MNFRCEFYRGVSVRGNPSVISGVSVMSSVTCRSELLDEFQG